MHVIVRCSTEGAAMGWVGLEETQKVRTPGGWFAFDGKQIHVLRSRVCEKNSPNPNPMVAYAHLYTIWSPNMSNLSDAVKKVKHLTAQLQLARKRCVELRAEHEDAVLERDTLQSALTKASEALTRAAVESAD